MIGIKSYGAYIPLMRLSQADIAQAFDKGPAKGELAKANFDEDTITMGVEAGIDCLKGIDRNIVDAVYMATTTPPYREKQSATVISQALGLPRTTQTADVAHSLRAGTIGLGMAMGTVGSGRAKNVLLVGSEMRIGYPGGEYERVFGDGSGAILIGDTDLIATIEEQFSISDEIVDNWKAEEDPFVKSWEDRFVLTQGYDRTMREAIIGLMKKSAMLVSVSRGGIVNEEALAKALREGKLAAAAMDVFSVEPLQAESELWELDNLILAPHIAGGSQFEGDTLLEIITENLGKFLRGESPLRNQVDKKKQF